MIRGFLALGRDSPERALFNSFFLSGADAGGCWRFRPTASVVLGLPMRWGMGYALGSPVLLPGLTDNTVAFWAGNGGSMSFVDFDDRMSIGYTQNRWIPGWVDWFDGLTLTNLPGGEAELHGPVRTRRPTRSAAQDPRPRPAAARRQPRTDRPAPP